MNARWLSVGAALYAGMADWSWSQAAESPATLWRVGRADGSPAEFALAPGEYRQFFSRFGSPDRAYYIGLSKPERDWPYMLPGPIDEWAGGGKRAATGGWDMLHTLPIGFVLADPPSRGRCALALHIADSHPDRAARLRATVNGEIFERELAPGGTNESLIRGITPAAKPQVVRIDFPATLLRRGYNEIALRSTAGSWLVFDAVELKTPAGAKLAERSDTVVRSVTAAGYAVATNPKTAATLRVEIYRAGPVGVIDVEVDGITIASPELDPGLQILEIPVAATGAETKAQIRLSSDGRVVHEQACALPTRSRATTSDYVDQFLGTAHSRWMLAPGPWMPFGMVKLSPDNQAHGWCSGYEYSHEFIDCFSHIHEWTMGGLGVMPYVGPIRTQPGLDGRGYSSRIDKRTERAGIGFYEVVLSDPGIKVELTATTRAALQRYTFPAANDARVAFDFFLPNEYPKQVLGSKVRRTGPAEITGTIQTNFAGAFFDNRFDLHFVAQFSRPFERIGGWQDDERLADAAEVATRGGDCGMWVEFRTAAGEEVLLRTGISLVSIENARLNLETELVRPFGWDFGAVVRNQRRAWDDLLGCVELETPDAREKTRFYTNLYRAMSGRNIWSDVNGEWVDPEERRQKLSDPTAVMLGGDAFWNTFWNLNQVMNLLTPEWSARWAKSLLAMYDTNGWLSKGPAGLEYIAVMVAEHEIPLLAAAHHHGIKGLDAKKILAAAVKMQTTSPQPHPGGGYVGNEHLENYLRHGYVALDGAAPAEPAKWRRPWVSNTFEYAYDDWCVAELARSLGRNDVAGTFSKRAESWRNVFDTELGFARPRKANGEWLSPFDPYNTPGFVEGNAWQYTWFVPHDVPRLVQAMGRERFVARLNEAFEKSAPTRFSSPSMQHNLTPINHGNQPSMQVAWLFNWAGEPWRTQHWTRALLDTYYGHNPADAYLGDEDQGQMSAWFVMAALGLFQTDGGCRMNPIYEIGSPLYRKAVIRLSAEHYGGKTFTIEAPHASRTNRYIQSAQLNGQPLDHWWIYQRDILNGGRLVLELGSNPNKQWAVNGTPP